MKKLQLFDQNHGLSPLEKCQFCGFLKPMFSLFRKACCYIKRRKSIFYNLFLRSMTCEYRRLQGVTGAYKRLQGVTLDYNGMRAVTGGYTRLHELTRGKQGVTGCNRGFQGVIEGYMRLHGARRG